MTAVKVLADAIEKANAASREIAEGAAHELIEVLRGAGFVIVPPDPQFPPAEVYNAIRNERIQQDQQWGGPDHDDTHELEDWCMFIEYQLERCNGVGGPEYRERMVKVAALAVAAIEAWDRNYANVDQPSTQMGGNANG